MKCPYCAEEIKDEALLCQFCQRDLVVFRPILERLSEVEEAISGLRSSIDSGLEDISTGPVDKVLVAVASSILLAVISCWLTWLYPDSYSPYLDKPLNFISVASPFLAALWLGWSLPRLRLTTYFIVGVSPGFLGFVAWFLFHTAYQGHYPSNWKSNLVVYVASATLWFLAGGAIGARIRGTRIQASKVPGVVVSSGNPNWKFSQEMVLGIVHDVAYILVALLPYVLAKK